MKKHLWLCIPLKAGLLTFLILNSTFIILNSPLASAQAPNFLWAQSAGETSTDVGYSVSTDAGGNVFVTGFFGSPTITFGTTTLTNAGAAGNADIFIVKYGASGTVLWAQSAGGTAGDYGNSVSTDASGNVFVTGYFQGPTITFGTTTLTNVVGNDIFIVKYDNSGTVLWAKSAGGTSVDLGLSVSTDAGGNVFVTGYFDSPTITFGTTTLTNAGNTDIFIVKYAPSGTVLWAKSAGGSSDDYGYSVSTDPAGSGDVFVTGHFYSPTITFGTTTLTNAGSWGDIFIVKYDSAGTVLWAKSAGGTADDYGWSVSADAGGNVFVTGYFESPTITFGTTALTNAGNRDIFIVKYDTSGTVLWAKSAGGTSLDYGNSVSTDAGGNVFVTGYFQSPTITFGTTTLTGAGGMDIFIVKYDAAGTVLWAKSAGGTSNDYGLSVSTDAGGNVFVTGSFQQHHHLWNNYFNQCRQSRLC